MPINSESAYARASAKLRTEVAADEFRTAETRADKQADLIAADEVNRDLYAVAATIGGTARTVTARYVYATSVVRSKYQQAVADVGIQVSIIAPEIDSRSGARISDEDSAALVRALNSYSGDCAAVAASSATHKPAPAATIVFHHPRDLFASYHWVCTPPVVVDGIFVQYATCKFVKR